MGKIPGINHQDGVRALKKASFRMIRQGKHAVLSECARILPRHNPIHAYTPGVWPCAGHRAFERICKGLANPNDKKFYLLSGSVTSQ